MSRFQVHSVTGYPITPYQFGQQKGNRPPPTGYVVLDSAVCYRIMREYVPCGGRYDSDAHRRARAERLAAELNEAYP